MENKQMIISIGRQCGSGGHEIGKILANHYGIQLYDRNIITLLAEQYNQDPEKLAKLEERVTGQILPVRKGGFAASEGVLMSKMTKSDTLYLQERELIRSLAQKESFVIVGRAANAILDGFPNTLRLYVYADEDFKVARVKQKWHLDSDKEAKKKIEQIDKARRDYFHYYSDMVWASSDGHDISIKSSTFGIDGTVDILINVANRRFGIS